jgi:hypothetical protein
VAITDEQIAVLRSMLTADGEYDRLTDQLDRTDGWGDYTILIAAAFFEAVDRRFGKGYTRAEIVQFVAHARARFDQSGHDLDALAAERLVLSALEEESVDDLDDKTVVQTQIVFLTALITDEQLDAPSLDEFLAEARKLADEWTS